MCPRRWHFTRDPRAKRERACISASSAVPGRGGSCPWGPGQADGTGEQWSRAGDRMGYPKPSHGWGMQGIRDTTPGPCSEGCGPGDPSSGKKWPLLVTAEGSGQVSGPRLGRGSAAGGGDSAEHPGVPEPAHVCRGWWSKSITHLRLETAPSKSPGHPMRGH